MYKYIENRFALSNQGAKDFTKGVLSSSLLNICLMFPAVIIFLFLDSYLKPLVNSLFSAKNDLVFFIITSIFFMLITYFVALLQYNNTYTKVYKESAIRRINLAEKLRKLPLAFFGKKNLSDLTSSIMDDCTDLEMTFSHAVPQLFASILSITIVATGLFFYNWQLSLALFWVVPIAALVLLISRSVLNKNNKKQYWSKRQVSERINEGIEYIQEIKSFSQEENYIENLEIDLNQYEKNLIKSELLAGTMVNGAQSILKLGMASVAITGILMINKSQTDIFTLLIFLMVSTTVYQPINDVFNHLAALLFLDVRINRSREINSLPTQEGSAGVEINKFDIDFDNVNFEYQTGKSVLNGISFTAIQGEVTALVGPSGCGKSTIAKLAARFWDINSGSIKLGGTDIKNIDPEELLKHYSIVFQDVTLFNASIYDNIKIGRKDASMTDIIKAAKLAQCDNFVNKMPKGYDTIIGENGQSLSGGERQRISIARALLKDAPIVLLDEASASLDVENETLIQRGISELIKDKTVIVIAHRLRTVENADKIIELKNGEIENIKINKKC
ncbi:MAG: ABC transporter ATP-binding protein/permease [Marinifilaceae bacterium]|jgi:ATP-binding cassette subfamily B protein|nr:ABC transporter ATP-binding protein/permease [Marinifilaceae bacterium]